MVNRVTLLMITSLCCISFKSYSYTQDDINLSDFEFQRYVKPRLINITQDYYGLIMAVNPELKEFKPVSKILFKIKAQLPKLTSTCSKLGSKKSEQELIGECLKYVHICQDQLNKTSKISVHSKQFIKKDHFTSEDLLVNFDKSFQLFNQIEILKSQFLDLEFKVLTKMTKSYSYSKLTPSIELTETILNDYLIQASDSRFRDTFMAFWSDFIRPVNNLILTNSDKALFVRRLNDLNLRLNFLNVALTKRNKDVNKQAKTLLKIIHNNWNNILKVTLRR